jgi:cytochrome c-type biogenesis protein CcmH/NrfF
LKRRFRKLVLITILAATPLTRAADRNERIRELSSKFMCVCGGCNQLLSNCNHMGCASREGMLKDLTRQIDQGKDDAAIIAYFADKYGTTVLSAPPASGFNLMAWLMPFGALAIGSMAAVVLVRRFRSRWAPAGPAPNTNLEKYQGKVEEELKKFIPED